jgi:hypothetical protein
MGEPQTKNQRPQRGSSRQTNPQEKKREKEEDEQQQFIR